VIPLAVMLAGGEWGGAGVSSYPLPGNEFNYLLVSNLAPVAVETRSWTEVKAPLD